MKEGSAITASKYEGLGKGEGWCIIIVSHDSNTAHWV